MTLRSVLVLVGTIGAASILATACAAGDASFENDDGGGAATTTAVGGMGGGGSSSSSSGTGGNTGPCGTDCSLINTPQCQVAQCNVQAGQCEVVNDEEGVACDDGVFCTIRDSCSAGTCVGGPQNDCGMAPPQCTEVTCDETSQTCSSAPSMNGAACQDPNDLCLKGSTCSNGLCIGGQQDDCFFFPVPSDCHVANCNPMSGMCEAEVGNDGGACNDPNDLCTVQKVCDNMGMCTGGSPKDCSQLTNGCVLGVCDVNTGQCVTQNLMNNDPCDDLDACTTGEICNNGACNGGTPITACVNNDNCCPMNCNENNDQDCAKEEYTHSFTSGSLPLTSPQCIDWGTFTTQLTGSFSSVTIRGSNDPTGVTCNNASMATQLCNALNTSTVVSGLNCNGRVWNVGDCSVQTTQPYEINSRTVSGDCSCDSAYTVRPCIGNNNWGGINGSTCSGGAQTMEVICNR
jgi:hypothetical protein